MPSLEIYKASAGSGKTFSIVLNYLTLVLQRPASYRNILAVTFTNKATTEMKDRVLKELQLLSTGEASGQLNELMKRLKKSEVEIRTSARFILKSILHDYSRFSVSTIDSFFQRVVRSFSREMYLNSSFRTEIDTRSVLDEAVDRIFLEIDNNDELRNWMLNYAEEKLSEGKDWNFRKELVGRGELVFSEAFKTFGEGLLQKLKDKSYLIAYGDTLRKIVAEYEDELKRLGNQGLSVLGQSGLKIDDFKYGTNSFANHFQKLSNANFEWPGKRVIDACNNPDSWYTTKTAVEKIARIQSVYDELNQLLCQSIETMNAKSLNYNSAKAILGNLFTFGLTTDIALKINEVSVERNMMLLNDSGHLLMRVIGDQDAPFVYEKMGEVYHHFMLDEFQDTSQLQYRNFRPLITNALSEGYKSMVVGDVKQSIYRWRNGDWNLLANQLEHDFSHFGVETKPLSTNWRSGKNVIFFNNTFFKFSAQCLNETFDQALSTAENYTDSELKGIIQKAYDDHYQNVSPKSKVEGEVLVKFFASEKNILKSEFQTQALEAMIDRIEELQAAGIHPSDIAILVRKRGESEKVVKALFERKAALPDSGVCYNIVSNDSLAIGQSIAVQFIVDMLKIVSHQGNDIVRAELQHFYQIMFIPEHKGFGNDWNANSLLTSWLNGENINQLLSLPLYELVTQIIADFKLNTIDGQLTYIQTFLDIVTEYHRAESGGIFGFLEWWEMVGRLRMVTMAEVSDAMRLLTIHKAKGLEFKAIIIPFCDWSLYPKTPGTSLWVHPSVEPFSQLDLVLVDYGKQLANSIFAGDYFREMLYSLVDNLNLLYVAFTRAVSSLTVFAPYAEAVDAPKTAAHLLQLALGNPPLLDSDDLERCIDFKSFWDEGSHLLRVGSFVQDGQMTIDDANGLLIDRLQFADNSERLGLKLHSEGYFNFHQGEKAERINYGRLVHEIFEHIKSRTDVEPTLHRMVAEGKILRSEKGNLQNHIEELMKNEPVSGWFDGSWKVLNERDILRGANRKHRPDRVMMRNGEVVILDYKTGEQRDKDIHQVKEYAADIQRMGHVNIKAYIWYIEEDKLIDVFKNELFR